MRTLALFTIASLIIPNVSSARCTNRHPCPMISIMPQTLTFPDEMVGQSSPPMTTVATNVGVVTVSIVSQSLSGGADAANFHLGGNCPGSTLPPGASCSINAVFEPVAEGSFLATGFLTDATGRTYQ